MEKKVLEAYLAKVSRKGKVIYGTREVVEELKGSKAVIVSKSVDQKVYQKLKRDCKKHSIPLIEYDGNSIELGRAVGRNFRISAFSIKSTGGYELKEVLPEEGQRS
ncbi:MAG: ribosomal L7Ae/L30e/S12e/Gadd45 family protein [Nitrososphaeria archaeon]